MTNPINPFNRSSGSSISSSTDKTQSRPNSDNNAASTKAVSTDTVSLSQESQQVIDLQQRLKNTPEIDSTKVEAIKQEIAKGNYPLDAEKIAENLINLEQSLLE